MKKVNYQLTAMSPIFTGDDEQFGTTSIFRRRTYSLPTPVVINSSFKNPASRSCALMDIIYSVYANVKKGLKAEYYGYYAPFANNLKAAAQMPNKKAFLNRLMELCGIPVLADGSAQTVRQALDKFSDSELIQTVRNEHQYLMILLREYVHVFKEFNYDIENVNFRKNLFGDDLEKEEPVDYVKNTELVPFIAGNSIRGAIRRLAMADFARRAGITSFKKEIYHQLFTGGNLTGSTGDEDIDFRERYSAMCPMIRLLGSAIGNQMLQSEMNVFAADICCSELGTGTASFWELLEIDFGTRRDSSKTEKEFEIEGEMKEISQMMYQLETVIPGAKFSGRMVLTTENPLVESAFWHAIQLFKDSGIVGGRSSSGNGMVDVDIEIPQGAADLYCNYIEENKEDIQAFFEEFKKQKPEKEKKTKNK